MEAETLRLLEAYPWPGNVRELQGVMQAALLRARGDSLTPGCLPEQLVRGSAAAVPSALPAAARGLDLVQVVRNLLASGQGMIYERACLQLDRIVLAEVLRHVGGNKLRASRLLGISPTPCAPSSRR